MKTCSKCGYKGKAFYADGNVCKKCKAEYMRNRYQSADIKLSLRSWSAQRNRENQHKITDYLKIHPCCDCGENDPIVLDFDHVRGRKYKGGIARLMQRCAAWRTIENEIEKCEVRCANCHRKKTAKHGNWYRTR